MITYLALRLTTGDYYWGSTSMSLSKRENLHRGFKGNDHFHNSLKKYPEEWVFLQVWDDPGCGRWREQLMLDYHYGKPGCLNISNRGQGFSSGDLHPRRISPESWPSGDSHPRRRNPEKWANAVGENHWTKKADPAVLKKMAEHLPPPKLGDANPMRNPEVAKKVAKWKQGKNQKVWIEAESIYQIWVSSNRPKPSAKAWAKQTGFPPHSLRSMVNHFLDGWIPSEDNDWISWKASLVL